MYVSGTILKLDKLINSKFGLAMQALLKDTCFLECCNNILTERFELRSIRLLINPPTAFYQISNKD